MSVKSKSAASSSKTSPVKKRLPPTKTAITNKTIHTQVHSTPVRLTKAFLMAVPAGGYLVSNVSDYPGAIFEDVVASSMPERQAQWTRIVFVGANSRLCYVYDSKKKYDTLQGVHAAERAKQRAIRAEKYALGVLNEPQQNLDDITQELIALLHGGGVADTVHGDAPQSDDDPY